MKPGLVVVTVRVRLRLGLGFGLGFSLGFGLGLGLGFGLGLGVGLGSGLGLGLASPREGVAVLAAQAVVDVARPAARLGVLAVDDPACWVQEWERERESDEPNHRNG